MFTEHPQLCYYYYYGNYKLKSYCMKKKIHNILQLFSKSGDHPIKRLRYVSPTRRSPDRTFPRQNFSISLLLYSFTVILNSNLVSHFVGETSIKIIQKLRIIVLLYGVVTTLFYLYKI